MESYAIKLEFYLFSLNIKVLCVQMHHTFFSRDFNNRDAYSLNIGVRKQEVLITTRCPTKHNSSE